MIVQLKEYSPEEKNFRPNRNSLAEIKKVFIKIYKQKNFCTNKNLRQKFKNLPKDIGIKTLRTKKKIFVR